jgi:hypothetical protein
MTITMKMATERGLMMVVIIAMEYQHHDDQHDEYKRNMWYLYMESLVYLYKNSRQSPHGKQRRFMMQ